MHLRALDRIIGRIVKIGRIGGNRIAFRDIGILLVLELATTSTFPNSFASLIAFLPQTPPSR